VANPYYHPGAKRAAGVHDLFGAIARRYDLINDIQSAGLHRVWKRRLVRLAQITPGTRALDLCCGTGDLALALARAGAQTVGLDFSEPMLAVARERDRAGIRPARGQVVFVPGDALRIPFAADTFDIVTMGYGLRNLASVEAGLAEMWRVARPGGRLLVLDFGKPDRAWWRQLYFGYLRVAVPVFGRCLAGSSAAYAYILESLERYPGQRGVAERMQQLPLDDVGIENLLGGVMAINHARKRAG